MVMTMEAIGALLTQLSDGQVQLLTNLVAKDEFERAFQNLSRDLRVPN